MRTTRPTGAAVIPKPGRGRQGGHLLLHYVEMCLPMCIGFAVGDAVYFAIARGYGYSDPFRQLPELSVVVVTLTMTAPMVAWMAYRGLDRRATFEMALVMPILAVALLVGGWAGVLARGRLALLEHGLMMPAMLVPMLIHLDLHTGRAAGAHDSRLTASRPPSP